MRPIKETYIKETYIKRSKEETYKRDSYRFLEVTGTLKFQNTQIDLNK